MTWVGVGHSSARALKLDNSERFMLVRLTANRMDKFKPVVSRTRTRRREPIKATLRSGSRTSSKRPNSALRCRRLPASQGIGQDLDRPRSMTPNSSGSDKAAKRDVSAGRALEHLQRSGNIEGWTNRVSSHPLTNYPLLDNLQYMNDLTWQHRQASICTLSQCRIRGR